MKRSNWSLITKKICCKIRPHHGKWLSAQEPVWIQKDHRHSYTFPAQVCQKTFLAIIHFHFISRVTQAIPLVSPVCFERTKLESRWGVLWQANWCPSRLNQSVCDRISYYGLSLHPSVLRLVIWEKKQATTSVQYSFR